VIDGLDKRIRRRRHEREDVNVDRLAVLLDWADVPLPDARKSEQRTRLLTG
jgi:hypothetical protein